MILYDLIIYLCTHDVCIFKYFYMSWLRTVHLQMAISITKEATDTLRNDHAQIPRLAPGLNVADPRVSLEIAQAMAGTWICPKKYLRGEAIESVGLSLQIFILTKTI